MEASIHILERTYPYMAVWTGGEPLKEVKLADIVIISMQHPDGSSDVLDMQTYVQPLLGSKMGYFTNNEGEYAPLPKGTKIEIIQ